MSTLRFLFEHLVPRSKDKCTHCAPSWVRGSRVSLPSRHDAPTEAGVTLMDVYSAVFSSKILAPRPVALLAVPMSKRKLRVSLNVRLVWHWRMSGGHRLHADCGGPLWGNICGRILSVARHWGKLLVWRFGGEQLMSLRYSASLSTFWKALTSNADNLTCWVF